MREWSIQIHDCPSQQLLELKIKQFQIDNSYVLSSTNHSKTFDSLPIIFAQSPRIFKDNNIKPFLYLSLNKMKFDNDSDAGYSQENKKKKKTKFIIF